MKAITKTRMSVYSDHINNAASQRSSDLDGWIDEAIQWCKSHCLSCDQAEDLFAAAMAGFNAGSAKATVLIAELNARYPKRSSVATNYKTQ